MHRETLDVNRTLLRNSETGTGLAVRLVALDEDGGVRWSHIRARAKHSFRLPECGSDIWTPVQAEVTVSQVRSRLDQRIVGFAQTSKG